MRSAFGLTEIELKQISIAVEFLCSNGLINKIKISKNNVKYVLRISKQCVQHILNIVKYVKYIFKM